MKTVHNTGIITSYLSDTQTRTRSHAHPLLSGSPVPALCRHLTNGGTFLGCNIDEICNHAMLWVCSIHVPIICVYSRFWFYMHILVFCFVFLLIAHTPNIHIDYIVKLRRHGYIAHMSCMCLSCFPYLCTWLLASQNYVDPTWRRIRDNEYLFLCVFAKWKLTHCCRTRTLIPSVCIMVNVYRAPGKWRQYAW